MVSIPDEQKNMFIWELCHHPEALESMQSLELFGSQLIGDNREGTPFRNWADVFLRCHYQRCPSDKILERVFLRSLVFSDFTRLTPIERLLPFVACNGASVRA